MHTDLTNIQTALSNLLTEEVSVSTTKLSPPACHSVNVCAPPKSLWWNPEPCGDGIRRWAPGEVSALDSGFSKSPNGQELEARRELRTSEQASRDLGSDRVASKSQTSSLHVHSR